MQIVKWKLEYFIIIYYILFLLWLFKHLGNCFVCQDAKQNIMDFCPTKMYW